MLRTTPGLGNVTLDWTLEGPFVERTFSKTSGTLYFTKVTLKLEDVEGYFVVSKLFEQRYDVAARTDTLFL